MLSKKANSLSSLIYVLKRFQLLPRVLGGKIAEVAMVKYK